MELDYGIYNRVIEILKNYENTNAGIKANLGRILCMEI